MKEGGPIFERQPTEDEEKKLVLSRKKAETDLYTEKTFERGNWVDNNADMVRDPGTKEWGPIPNEDQRRQMIRQESLERDVKMFDKCADAAFPKFEKYIKDIEGFDVTKPGDVESRKETMENLGDTFITYWRAMRLFLQESDFSRYDSLEHSIAKRTKNPEETKKIIQEAYDYYQKRKGNEFIRQ